MALTPVKPPTLSEAKLLQALAERIEALAQVLRGTPEVILDIVFEEGRFYVSVRNIGAAAAYDVSVRFAEPLDGMGGNKRVSEMALFRRISFLAPGREIRTFLDTSAAYFGRRAPTAVSATVAYQDKEKRRFTDAFHHDLDIYRDVGWLTHR